MTLGLDEPVYVDIVAQHSNLCFGFHFQPSFDNAPGGLQSSEAQVQGKDWS